MLTFSKINSDSITYKSPNETSAAYPDVFITLFEKSKTISNEPFIIHLGNNVKLKGVNNFMINSQVPPPAAQTILEL